MDEKIEMEDVPNLEGRSSLQVTCPSFTPLALLLPPDLLDPWFSLPSWPLYYYHLSPQVRHGCASRIVLEGGGVLGTIRLIMAL